MFGRAAIRLGIGPHSSLCCILLVNKVHLSLNILVLMATGIEGNENQIQPGYGDCILGHWACDDMSARTPA